MNSAEQKLADVLMAAGYDLATITGILCAVRGFAELQSRDEVSAAMGSIAANALQQFAGN